MTDGSSGSRILLVEHEAAVALVETSLLTNSGYLVERVGDGETAVFRALESRFDLVLMDLDLGLGIDAGEAAKRIREGGGPPVLFLSSHAEESAIAEIGDSGGYGCIVKDSGGSILLASIRMALGLAAADAELKKALAEKDRLYAELQHRVKNSLALIVSLLSLKAGTIEDEELRAPIEEAQVRVRSIGLLYEQLYRTHSVDEVDLGAYLSEVARTVVESPLSPRGLRLESDCASLLIATDRAVPAGLLLYELVANSVKHAFPGRDGGKIALSLGLEGEWVELRVQDDGVGLGEGFDFAAESGLGSLLITQLAEQLGGSAEIKPGLGVSGAGFLVRFPVTLR
jgi:two-component sensor histidine kinase